MMVLCPEYIWNSIYFNVFPSPPWFKRPFSLSQIPLRSSFFSYPLITVSTDRIYYKYESYLITQDITPMASHCNQNKLQIP